MRTWSLRNRTLSLVCSMALHVAIAAAQGADMVPGQSSTLLPDGRLLLLGGEHSGAPQTAALVVDPRDGARTTLRSGLQQARAWHTATLLPTGDVFVLGGIGEAGQLLGSPEILDPERGTSSLFQMRGFDPRAFHTATLLTDGRVLIAGGRSQSGQVLSSMMLWDYRTNLLTPVEGGMNREREKHTATLLPDGRVLLRGGTDLHGAPINRSEIFDPESGHVTLQELTAPEPERLLFALRLRYRRTAPPALSSTAYLRFAFPARSIRRLRINKRSPSKVLTARSRRRSCRPKAARWFSWFRNTA